MKHNKLYKDILYVYVKVIAIILVFINMGVL